MTWCVLHLMKFSALSCKEQSVLGYFFFLFKDYRFPEASAEAGRLGMTVPF